MHAPPALHTCQEGRVRNRSHAVQAGMRHALQDDSFTVYNRRQDILNFFLPMQATVGAGLPVLSTLQALVQTGDAVARIEGMLSGTLSFIFNRLGPGRPFSQVVAEARAAGYTEPAPREDLSGGPLGDRSCLMFYEGRLANPSLKVMLQEI